MLYLTINKLELICRRVWRACFGRALKCIGFHWKLLAPLVLGFTILSFSENLLAFDGISGEAFCQTSRGSENSPEGYSIHQKMPIASISKVFISYWAIRKLGLNYRFTNKLFISKVDKKFYDIHIAGSSDPVLNHQMIHFLISELNGMGIYHIRNLSFDHRFRVALMVRENPGSMGPNGPNLPKSTKEVQENIQLMFNRSRWGKTLIQNYQVTRAIAKSRGIAMVESPIISLVSAEPAESPGFSNYTEHVFQSATLLSRLKEMNVYSNNMIADNLYYFLGGNEAFHSFIQNELDLRESDLVFYTGSGLPWKPSPKVRRDNLANCGIVLKALRAVDIELNKSGIPIYKLLLLSGVDGFDGKYYSGNFYEGGTMGKFYSQGSLRAAVAGKTGTLDTLKSLAGVAFTRGGVRFFSMIKIVRDSSQYEIAKARFLKLLRNLFETNKGAVPVNHKFTPFLPFDGESHLKVVSG